MKLKGNIIGENDMGKCQGEIIVENYRGTFNIGSKLCGKTIVGES